MKIILFSWFFLAAGVVNATHAEEIRIRDQRFQLGWSTTASAAAESYAPVTEKQIEKQLSRSEHVDFLDQCGFGGSKDYKCYLSDWGVDYLPPFPIELPHRTPKLPGLGNEITWGWVPIDQVNQGKQKLTQWREMALSGAVFDCEDLICHVLVEGVNEKQDSTEITYAVCRVDRVGDVIGAPRWCEQMAIILGEEIWLHAIIGSYSVAYAMGRPDFSLRILPISPSHALPTMKVVAKAIDGAFRDPPLALESQSLGDNAIIAAASFRVSPVLEGWREIVTIRVDLREAYWNGPGAIGVIISTTLYVNRQNTSAPRDWSLPTRQQEVLYLAQIRRQIRGAVASLCKKAEWMNQEDVLCKM